MRTARLLAALVATSATACATTLTTLTTAETLAEGEMQVAVGAGYYLGLGPLVKTISAAADEAERLQQAAQGGGHPAPTEEQKVTLLEAGLGLALTPPSPMFEASLRYGLFDGMDVGARWAPTSWHLDVKWRAWQGRVGPARAALALAPGGSRSSFSGTALDLLEYVQIDDFSRWDVEVPLFFSLSFGEVFKAYSALRGMWSRYSLDEKLLAAQAVAGAVAGEPIEVLHDTAGSIVHAGGTLGVAVGYKVMYLFVETGVHQVWHSVQLFGRTLDLGGLVIYPAAGLAVRW